MEEALRALLIDTPSVAAATGNRIAWVSHPQGTALPAVVLTVISQAEGHHMNGPNGLFQGRVQVDCYGGEYRESVAASRAIRARLHCYRDRNFRLITHVSTRDGRERGSGEVDYPYRISMDFTVAWRAD